MNAPNQLADMKSPAPREANMPAVSPGFGSLQSFELAMRQAKLLSSSTLVPAQYRQFIEKKKGRDLTWEQNANAVPNCVIAMNMAQRMNADPLMVMQNLYIVEGRPSWSSQWIIAAINSCKRFSPLRFDLEDLGQKEVEYTVTEWIDNQKTSKKMKQTVANMKCIAWAIEKETGEKITSPVVTVEMAVKEGWYQKNGSKWQTMPEIMLRYRTASFFGKLYAPELLMGLPSSEEVIDTAGTIDAHREPDGSFTVDVGSLKQPSGETIDTDTGEVIPDPDDDALRDLEQSGDASAPTFEDAIAAVKAGDHDLAADMARSFPDGQKAAVLKAIENATAPAAAAEDKPSRRRPSGALDIE